MSHDPPPLRPPSPSLVCTEVMPFALDGHADAHIHCARDPRHGCAITLWRTDTGVRTRTHTRDVQCVPPRSSRAASHAASGVLTLYRGSDPCRMVSSNLNAIFFD